MRKTVKSIQEGLLVFSVYIAFMSLLCDLPVQIYTQEAYSIQKLYYLIFPHELTGVLAFLAALWIRKLLRAKQPKKPELITSVAFSILFILSKFMSAVHTVSAVTQGLTMKMISLLFVIGMTYICCVAYQWLCVLYEKCLDRVEKENTVWEKQRIRLFLLFFLLRVPWILIKYPAGIEYDSVVALDQLFTGTFTTQQNPVGTTWLTGAFCLLGKKLCGSYEIGVFLYVLFLAALSSCVFVYCVHVLRKANVHRFWTNASVIMFAFSPVLESYMTVVNKDAIYSVALLYTVALWADDLFVSHSRHNMVCMSLSALFMTTLRNNGVYILPFCLLYVLICAIKDFSFRRMILPVVLPMLGFVFLSKVVYPLCGIGSTYAREYMSIPFQQTARYVTLLENEVTPEEKQVIATILDYECLPEVYDPYISDPVKVMYGGNGKDLDAYWSVWKEMLKKHPEVYVDAVYENIYGFIYPDLPMRNGHELSQYCLSVDTLNRDEFIVRQPEQLDGLRNIGKEVIDGLCTLPFVFPFVNTACQVWIMLFMTVYALCHRKKIELYLLVPSLVTLLMCIASPTYYYNGTRYALPILVNNILIGALLFGRGVKIRNDR